MKPIFKTVYGSFLYGTNVPTSDKDVKGVMLPTCDELLAGEIHKTFTDNTNNDSSRRNTSDDTDMQLYGLKKFLHDIVSGQSYALELLFSPEQFWIGDPDPIWHSIVLNKDKLTSKNVTAMVSYARAQAYKYGDKGKRLDVFRAVVGALEAYKKDIRLTHLLEPGNVTFLLRAMQMYPDFISVSNTVDVNKVEYFNVNGVQVPTAVTVEYALEVYKPRLAEYGARAKQASADKGNDLKAIYHAVRIAHQAEELLTFGRITLPRPEAPLLLQIRTGKYDEADLKRIVDESFEHVREAEKSSTLNAKPDKKWINDFLMDTHLSVIMKERNLCFGWNQLPSYDDDLPNPDE